MNRRPDSVLVIAVLCILLGAIACVGTLMYLAGNDYPIWVDPTRADDLNVVKCCSFLDGLVTLVCGFNFLHGANWARWLFTVEALATTWVYFKLDSDNLNVFVAVLVFRAICVLILFLPASHRFFRFHERKGR